MGKLSYFVDGIGPWIIDSATKVLDCYECLGLVIPCPCNVRAVDTCKRSRYYTFLSRRLWRSRSLEPVTRQHFLSGLINTAPRVNNNMFIIWTVLADFGAKALLDELGFDSQILAGCAAYMASELLSPDGLMWTCFPKSLMCTRMILVCQKVCIQLILSIKEHSQDSRYSPEKTLSLGTRKDTSIMEKCWVVSPGGRPSTKEILQLLGQ